MNGVKAFSQPPPYLVVRGQRYPPYFNPLFIEEALDYKAQDDDVFIVTYPKSGTRWMEQISYLIYSGGVPPESAEKLDAQAVFFEKRGLEAVRGIEKPGTIKYHQPYERTPQNAAAKYIVVIRNPKDACVSFFHHTRRLPYGFDGAFDDYFELWLDGDVDFGDYFPLTLGWWRHRRDDNVLLLVYEHIKRDVKAAVLRVARFLGDGYERRLRDSDAMLADVVKYSDVEFMKTQDRLGLVRKGQVGDWRNHLSRRQSDRVDAKLQKWFAGTGLDTLWTEELEF